MDALPQWAAAVAIVVGVISALSAIAALTSFARLRSTVAVLDSNNKALTDEAAIRDRRIEDLETRLTASEEKNRVLERTANSRVEILAMHATLNEHHDQVMQLWASLQILLERADSRAAIQAVHTTLDEHHEQAMQFWATVQANMASVHSDLEQIHVDLTKRGRRTDDPQKGQS